MGWKSVKNLFWQSGDGEAEIDPEEMSDEEFAAMLSESEHAVPEHPVESVDPQGVEFHAGGAAGVEIDFQAQYDSAGIPNTDEVEQLERFLNGLDQALPHASKLAAAKAFLGAIGKSKQDVLTDAERKIDRVRGIRKGVEESTAGAMQQEQASIEALQAKIEEHRKRMEDMNRELEGVRHSCLVEESRLQAARVFFGNVAGGGGEPQGQ